MQIQVNDSDNCFAVLQVVNELNAAVLYEMKVDVYFRLDYNAK